MAKKFDPEEFCGIEEYGTSSPGLGGRLKDRPSDFVVEEIPVDKDEGGDLVLCRMEKKDMTTFQALNKVSSSLGVPRGSIGYAGLKDKRAFTTQFVTLKGLEVEEAELDEVGVQVEPVKRVSRPLRTGDLKGNRFVIKIRGVDISEEECVDRLKRLAEEVREGIPNYYGIQRFGGRRPVTHLVGRELLGRNYRKAVDVYLCRTFPTEPDRFKDARKRLEDEMDYGDALNYFPPELTYERQLLERIRDMDPSSQDSWKELFKVLPKNLRRLFVHAYQSYVFNRAVSKLMREGDIRNFPAKVPGYESRLSSADFDMFLDEELKSDGVELEDFRFREAGELSSRGTLRPVLMKPDIEVEGVGKSDEAVTATVSFTLKPGRYATVVMRELMKPSN